MGADALKALTDQVIENQTANVYTNPAAKGEEGKAQDMLFRLFEYFQKNPDKLPDDFQVIRAEEGTELKALPPSMSMASVSSRVRMNWSMAFSA